MRILEAVALGVADYRGALDLIGVAQRSRDLAEFRSVVASGLAVSDFLTMREWQRLEIYQESWRHVGGRYQMGAMIGDPGRTQAAVAVMRPTRDFSARDRELLDTVRPHLAWGNEAIRKRTEVERIYDKLRVPNRTAAGAMAHEAINGAAGYGRRP